MRPGASSDARRKRTSSRSSPNHVSATATKTSAAAHAGVPLRARTPNAAIARAAQKARIPPREVEAMSAPIPRSGGSAA